MNDHHFSQVTSESVSDGHPDKVADQISDAVLDYIIANDPNARVACETLVKSDFVVLAGEISTFVTANYYSIIKKVLKKIGYDHQNKGLDYKNIKVFTAINQQSKDIALGVNEGTGSDTSLGAGDQGIMYGYACDDNDQFLPNPLYYAHKILLRLKSLKKDNSWIYPDAKSQVSIKYNENGNISVESIVLSCQHSIDTKQTYLKQFMIDNVIKHVFKPELLKNTKFHINPTGAFFIGGPMSDAGLTGRKIMVDTYGGFGAHGGGAFSGKDPTKVDRSAAYMARYVAKNLVAAGIAKRCLIKIAYVIGKSDPVNISINCYNTAKIKNLQLEKIVKKYFSFKPKDLIEFLDLKKPIYLDTAAYGHFSSNSYSWEKLDHIETFKQYL